MSWQDYISRTAEAKHRHRVEQTHLPFPEKIRIIVELQKIDNALAKAAGRETGKVWEIEERGESVESG